VRCTRAVSVICQCEQVYTAKKIGSKVGNTKSQFSDRQLLHISDREDYGCSKLQFCPNLSCKCYSLFLKKNSTRKIFSDRVKFRLRHVTTPLKDHVHGNVAVEQPCDELTRLVGASEVKALLINMVEHLMGRQHRNSSSDKGTKDIEKKELYTGATTAAKTDNDTTGLLGKSGSRSETQQQRKIYYYQEFAGGNSRRGKLRKNN